MNPTGAIDHGWGCGPTPSLPLYKMTIMINVIIMIIVVITTVVITVVIPSFSALTLLVRHGVLVTCL